MMPDPERNPLDGVEDVARGDGRGGDPSEPWAGADGGRDGLSDTVSGEGSEGPDAAPAAGDANEARTAANADEGGGELDEAETGEDDEGAGAGENDGTDDGGDPHPSLSDLLGHKMAEPGLHGDPLVTLDQDPVSRKRSRPAMSGGKAAVEAAVARDPERYYAESLAHAFGYLRPGQPPDPDLEAQLREELRSAGVDLDRVQLAYETLPKRDQAEFRLIELQVALRHTLENIEELTRAAHGRVRAQLVTTDKVRLDLLKQAQAVFLFFESAEDRVGGVLDRIGERGEAAEKRVEAVVDKVTGNAKSVDGLYSALKVKFDRLDQVVYDLQERSSAMREEIRAAGADIRGAGPSVQRLALGGGFLGALAGGFVAFVAMLSLWLVLA